MTFAEVDTIYTNGNVYTVEVAQPWAEAFAIKGDKFFAVGSSADIVKLKTDKTKVIDLQGKFVMPGMVEDHIHPDMIAENRMNIEVQPETSYQEFSDKVATFVSENPDTKWIFGGPLNWLKDHAADIDGWGKPAHHKTLDQVVNDRPAFFWDLGAHAALVNSATMEKYGIKKGNQPPKGGSWDVDADGNPTGVLRETAANAVWEEFLKERTSPEDQAKRGFAPVFKELNAYGFTSITDVWARPWNVDAYQALEKSNDLTTRVTIYAADPGDWVSPWLKKMSTDFIAQGPTKFSDAINFIGVKFVMDGSAGGQTAMMKDPFKGTDNKGFWRNDPDDFKEKMLQYDKMGLTVRAHAVGDQAVSTVLDGIELARQQDSKLRHSVSHSVFVNPEDIHRFKELDAVAEVSPYFWMPDPAIETIRADVGAKRLDWVFPFRSLLSQGVHLSTGSDAPVSPIDPWKPMEGMITRQLPGGVGTPVNAKDEGIDLKTAIYIYTMGGAYAQYKENEIGSIVGGKYADFIVLNQNLFEVNSTDIHKTQVLNTIFGGVEVYKAD
jgi:predicted amidohydrolase YtcJ